ncbi:hypothetical protein ACP70R_003739 [Stipagrostis hirtigluma subsp. patula]
MAEIEVVSDGSGARKGEGQGGAPAAPDSVVDVYSAAVYRDLKQLPGFVERGDGGGGAAALREPDGNGYHARRAQQLAAHHQAGNVNATDHSHQTPLHWAAMRGATAVADLLLENGARLEATDVNGYRLDG